MVVQSEISYTVRLVCYILVLMKKSRKMIEFEPKYRIYAIAIFRCYFWTIIPTQAIYLDMNYFVDKIFFVKKYKMPSKSAGSSEIINLGSKIVLNNRILWKWEQLF